MKFAAASIIAFAILAALAVADVATVKKDVANIDSQAASLDKKLQSEDGSNYFSALAINGAAGDLDNAIKQGTTDTNANTETVSESDASDILNTLSSSTEPHVASISKRLVAIHDNLKKIGVAGIAKGTLNSINTDQQAFSAALIKQAPEDKKAEAQTLADKITADLAPAVQAYASD
ncbi:hypothetical protein BDZ90DRAFT_221878 [Jaminaea rosea]|uniref:Hydrophobic surface binding protein n=1 Tax=Jaminaea rosea TaxID=1569628 RepID=A0A316UN62_9BASI|nr:hypothetical protein BDZ90DRAFT_221878 [Jaminaea rosea]PWN26394.1 hypothetical protein BDZ90DRAFT_221878 [Jaminaea rosea]